MTNHRKTSQFSQSEYNKHKKQQQENHARAKLANSKLIYVAVLILSVLAGVLIWRIMYLDSKENNFLNAQGNRESIHTHEIHAERGLILDRNDQPLAVSTLLYEVIFDFKAMKDYPEKYKKLSELPVAGFDYDHIHQLIESAPTRRYYIAAKFLTPDIAERIKKFHIPGVYLLKQTRTYYPLGNITSQLIGFTNAKNQGQSGFELQENHKLEGKSGDETIKADAYGNLIQYLDKSNLPHNGKDIKLTIDSNIQYFTYKALKEGVINSEAKSGAAAVINPKTGEVLALASYPSFNPNNFADRSGQGLKERAAVDTFEPGSTMKPFIAALALTLNKVTPDTEFETSPGTYKIGKYTIHDDANFGKINVSTIIQKSSNVGILQVEKLIPKEIVYQYLKKLGFGSTSFLFPGINMGYLPFVPKMGELAYATLSFGYAMTSSVLELAHAYTIFGNDGKVCPLTLVLSDQAKSPCEQIISPKAADETLAMLNSVTNVHGTGILASIPGFDVSGKTGTSRKVVDGKFSRKHYNTIFAGLAPLNNPKLVIVVWIDDPQKGHFYIFGGVSAAPVFSQIANESLRYLGVPYAQNLDKYNLINRNKQWLLKVIANN